MSDEDVLLLEKSLKDSISEQNNIIKKADYKKRELQSELKRISRDAKRVREYNMQKKRSNAQALKLTKEYKSIALGMKKMLNMEFSDGHELEIMRVVDGMSHLHASEILRLTGMGFTTSQIAISLNFVKTTVLDKIKNIKRQVRHPKEYDVLKKCLINVEE